MPQCLGWEATVQVGGLQQWMSGQGTLYARGVNMASGLFLQVLISPNVIGVGMCIENHLQLPPVLLQELPNFSPGVFVISAVNQADLIVLQKGEANFNRCVDIVAPRPNLNQFIHNGGILSRGIFFIITEKRKKVIRDRKIVDDVLQM